jgi:hypothetical protein
MATIRHGVKALQTTHNIGMMCHSDKINPAKEEENEYPTVNRNL